MVVTILSKTGRKLTVGGKCFKESSKWLFTGLPTEFQAASVRLLGCFPCPKGRMPKAVLDKSDVNREKVVSTGPELCSTRCRIDL